MKTVEIVPRARARLYGTLVAKQDAIRKSGRGTYVRVGRKSQRAARWKHKKFKGTLQLNRGESEAVTAKVRAATRFLRRGGEIAVITTPALAAASLRGADPDDVSIGTRIVNPGPR